LDSMHKAESLHSFSQEFSHVVGLTYRLESAIKAVLEKLNEDLEILLISDDISRCSRHHLEEMLTPVLEICAYYCDAKKALQKEGEDDTIVYVPEDEQFILGVSEICLDEMEASLMFTLNKWMNAVINNDRLDDVGIPVSYESRSRFRSKHDSGYTVRSNLEQFEALPVNDITDVLEEHIFGFTPRTCQTDLEVAADEAPCILTKTNIDLRRIVAAHPRLHPS